MDSLSTSISQFFILMPLWLNAALAAVTAASAITALTPTPKDDKLVGKAYRILEVIALNIGHAKEK